LNTTPDATEIYYRLPVNLEFVAIAMRDESPGIVFFIDLATGGVFSLKAPEDGDWEGAGEGFDHSIACGFSRELGRFLCIEAFSAREKRSIIEEFAATLGDQVLGRRLRQVALDKKPFTSVADALMGRPAELCSWREHVEKACIAAAAEFLKFNEIANEPRKLLESTPVLDAALFVN
jgi:hypothetical protein